MTSKRIFISALLVEEKSHYLKTTFWKVILNNIMTGLVGRP